ncbi:MAG: hypothetical protein ACHP79_07120 [Terriglobales bacterium]
MMIAAARRGMRIVRLKSGDPGIFGRLAEERAAQRTGADLHTPALEEDLSSLLQIIGAEPSAPSHNEGPERSRVL